jgi:hypothetical protein
VLLLLVLAFILAPLSQAAQLLWVRVLIQGLTTMFALHTSRVQRRTLTVAGVVFSLSLVIAAAFSLSQGRRGSLGSIEFLIALLIAIAVPSMLRRILTAESVTGEVILGALDVYVFVGMFFAALYAAIDTVTPNPFFVGEHGPMPGSYQFFSFTTLTTVGYGNLVPATQLGQSLAVLEALMGQIYLVTLVARLVSAYQPGQRRRAIERLEDERRATREAPRELSEEISQEE